MGLEIDFEEWIRTKQTVEDLDHCINGNGQPGLEEKLRRDFGQLVAHKQRGNDQAMVDLKHVQDKRHEENTKKLDSQSRLIWMGVGIMITLQTLALIFLKKG